MKQLGRALALAMGASALLGASPVDPNAQAAVHSTHSSGFHQGHSMRAMLLMSASVVKLAAVQEVALYDGMGMVDFPITTTSPDAQRYFNQGLAFAYGFNHAGAIASFREAQRLDPACAMCWWGEAFAHGPNINAPMDAAANERAFTTASYAASLARDATPAERALTAAMLKRYSLDRTADRAALDASFADAMLATASEHGSHDDIALVAAEAAMNTRPWDYWSADKTPHQRIGEAVKLVETVLARNPTHPQAAHLYIHLMENGPDPRLAEAAADRLNAPLAPRVGHLVHMPAHIFYRLGRWQDSIRSNIAAARADEAWIQETGDTGLVRYGYYPHNVHFIVTSAQMAGEMPTAIREARRLEALLDPAISSQIAWIQAINAAPYFAAAQFAEPADILAMPAPDARLPYATAMRSYARAVAYVQRRDRKGFEAEIAAISALRTSDAFQSMIAQGVPAPDLLQLAETVARARWASAHADFAEAARLYRIATSIEEKMPYGEPPYWYYPVHQSLGAALYQSGNHREARTAFETALSQSPNNGWVLYGLAESARALGLKDEAAAASSALEKAWSGDRAWLRMDRL